MHPPPRPPRLLILGAGGQVGHALGVQARAAGIPCLALVRAQAPLDDPNGLAQALRMAEDFAPTHTINAAAHTAVDQAELEPERAFRINAHALSEVGAWAQRHGVAVIHFSTDYVETPSVYGRSKREGEQRLQDSGAEHLILRTRWVFGDQGENFMKTMLGLALKREELRVVNDQWGSPTRAEWLAQDVLRMVQRWSDWPAARGLQAWASAGRTHWRDYAAFAIAQAQQMRPDLPWILRDTSRVHGISTEDYEAMVAPKRLAPRPRQSELDCAGLEKATGLERPVWELQVTDALKVWAAAQ